jgi:hypothetical protein
LSQAKSSFIASIKTENHYLLVYEDSSEKNYLAALFVEAALKRKDLIVLFASDNEGILRSVIKRRGSAMRKAIAKKTLLLFDFPASYGKPPSLAAFESFFRKILQEGHERGLRISWLGEFPVEYYDGFDIENEIERFVDSYKVSRRPTGLCMNRKSAILSLEPRQLVSLIEAHDSILFDTTPFSRSDYDRVGSISI